MRRTIKGIIERGLLGKPAIRIYARPDGLHVHADKECVMLVGDQFKRLGYKEITPTEAQRRHLHPCWCLEKAIGGNRADKHRQSKP